MTTHRRRDVPVVPDADAPVEALHWKPLSRKRVRCTLCYRNCELDNGQTGFCKVRTNVDGVLMADSYGEVGALLPLHNPAFAFRPGALAVWVNGHSCTSHCSFCASGDLALHAERLPRLQTEGPSDNQWSHEVWAIDPVGIMRVADDWGATDVHFGGNEPTLSFEYTLAVAKLAIERSMYTTLDTNGFTDAAAIAELSPHIDHVYLGIKGQLDPEFYAKRMRSPGAEVRVKESLLLWRDSPTTHLTISDIMPPLFWVDDATFERNAYECYSWIAQNIGEHTPFELYAMVRPNTYTGLSGQPMLPRNATHADKRAFFARYRRTIEIARECGLAYSYRLRQENVFCHACGGLLYEFTRVLDTPGIFGRRFRGGLPLHVTPDSKCEHCGAAVPIVPAYEVTT